MDADYFKFTVASLGSVDVTIQFWNAANDLDLFVYDSGGNLVSGSAGSDDLERVVLNAFAGDTFYVSIEGRVRYTPTFYDLAISTAGFHDINVTSHPRARRTP